MRQKILFLGDSHTAVVMHGMRKLHPEFQILGNGLPFGTQYPITFHSAEKPLVFTRDVVNQQLQAYLAPVGIEVNDLLDIEFPVVYCLSGVTQTSPRKLWVRHRPYRDETYPYLQHISQAYLEEALGAYYQHLFHFFELLTSAGRTPVVVIAPAPHLNVNKSGLLHRLVREYAVLRLEERGAKVVDINAATTNEYDILLEEFQADAPEDCVHANVRWGELAAREICTLLAL
ncbi:hypothetical protein [Kordiimonas aestuarii]|uniref:hypothetical protein n=1 Tax=Kordiimonas aestuarii TaxID=1005925 RepID=UPI0021D32B47|nr:hypothetical protein [Kordiimonas aestuarii]